MEVLQESVSALMELEHMTQVELAAALNVSQAAVGQWLSGVRRPGPGIQAAIARAHAAVDVEAVRIDAGLRRGPILIPVQLWEPVFRPTGRFRLPLHLEWSGSGEQRWRDARDVDRVLSAYTQVMVEGSARDIVTWIDPVVLAAHADRVLWPRCYEGPWREALARWGLL